MSIHIHTFQGYDYTGCSRYASHGDFFYRLATKDGHLWVIKGKMSTMTYSGGVDTGLDSSDYSLWGLCANDNNVWVALNRLDDSYTLIYCCTTALVTTGSLLFDDTYVMGARKPYIACSDSHAYVGFDGSWSGFDPYLGCGLIQLDATPAQTDSYIDANGQSSNTVCIYATPEDVVFWRYKDYLRGGDYVLRLDGMEKTAEVLTNTVTLGTVAMCSDATQLYICFPSAPGGVSSYNINTLEYVASYSWSPHNFNAWIGAMGGHVYVRISAGAYVADLLKLNPNMTLDTQLTTGFGYNETNFGATVANGFYYIPVAHGITQDGITYGGGWAKYGIDDTALLYALLLGPRQEQSNAVWYFGI
jgi:hypothetical protein